MRTLQQIRERFTSAPLQAKIEKVHLFPCKDHPKSLALFVQLQVLIAFPNFNEKCQYILFLWRDLFRSSSNQTIFSPLIIYAILVENPAAILCT